MAQQSVLFSSKWRTILIRRGAPTREKAHCDIIHHIGKYPCAQLSEPIYYTARWFSLVKEYVAGDQLPLTRGRSQKKILGRRQRRTSSPIVTTAIFRRSPIRLGGARVFEPCVCFPFSPRPVTTVVAVDSRTNIERCCPLRDYRCSVFKTLYTRLKISSQVFTPSLQ